MSSITVVTRITPITSVPEDLTHFLKPSDLGKPVEVHKRTVTDPRTGLKYNVETTFCVGKTNDAETHKKSGLLPLTSTNCALDITDEKTTGEEFIFSVPKNLPKTKVTKLLKSSKIKKLDKEIPSQSRSGPKNLPKEIGSILTRSSKLKEHDKETPSHPSIKLHLNLKKIREATRQQSLCKKREKLVQTLFKYFVDSECLICGTILDESSKNKIQTHMFLHIKLGTYACQNCENKCFPTADALYNHTLKHSESEKYNCDICAKKFTRKHFLSTHYQKEHPEFQKRSTPRLTANLIKKKVPMCFVCTVSTCKEKLTSWKALLNHKESHSGKEGYLCLFCNMSFSTSCLLRYHTHVSIISKRYSCKSCHKAFSSIHNLHKHEKLHSKKVKFECKKCEKKFNFKNSLLEHMQLLHS